MSGPSSLLSLGGWSYAGFDSGLTFACSRPTCSGQWAAQPIASQIKAAHSSTNLDWRAAKPLEAWPDSPAVPWNGQTAAHVLCQGGNLTRWAACLCWVVSQPD